MKRKTLYSLFGLFAAAFLLFSACDDTVPEEEWIPLTNASQIQGTWRAVVDWNEIYPNLSEEMEAQIKAEFDNGFEEHLFEEFEFTFEDELGEDLDDVFNGLFADLLEAGSIFEIDLEEYLLEDDEDFPVGIDFEDYEDFYDWHVIFYVQILENIFEEMNLAEMFGTYINTITMTATISGNNVSSTTEMEVPIQTFIDDDDLDIDSVEEAWDYYMDFYDETADYERTEATTRIYVSDDPVEGTDTYYCSLTEPYLITETSQDTVSSMLENDETSFFVHKDGNQFRATTISPFGENISIIFDKI